MVAHFEKYNFHAYRITTRKIRVRWGLIQLKILQKKIIS